MPCTNRSGPRPANLAERSRRRWLLAPAISIIAASTVILVGCGAQERPPREDAVRQMVDAAERFAEDGDTAALGELVSDRYLDTKGNNKQAILLLIHYYLSANRSVHLLTRVPRVSFADSTHADLIVFVAMAGRPIEGPDELMRLNADLYHIYASVVEEDGQWQIVAAKWARGWEPDVPLPDHDGTAGSRQSVRSPSAILAY